MQLAYPQNDTRAETLRYLGAGGWQPDAASQVLLQKAEDALRAVAKKAIERKTGARSLKGIIEDVMLDVMYDIPKSKEPRKVIITKACINEGEKPEVIALDK